MNIRFLNRLWALPLLWFVCLAFLLPVWAQSTYTLIDMGANLAPMSMNNAGQVVGIDFSGKPFVWDRVHGLQYLQLPFPANISSFYPRAINDAGDIAGNAVRQEGVLSGFLCRNGTVTIIDPPDLIGNLDPGSSSVNVTGIDAAGRLTGYTTSRNGATSPFLYDPTSGLHLIGSFVSNDSYGLGINGGKVVGVMHKDAQGTRRGFLYSGGQSSYLPTLGGPVSIASAINASGQIVGQSDTTRFNLIGNQLYHAFLYSGDQMLDLGTTGGFDNSSANAINASGQVVGVLSNPQGFGGQAFLWTPNTPNATTGTMQYLGSLLPPYTTRLIFSNAVAINDRGDITGGAFVPLFTFGDDYHGFVLTTIEKYLSASALILTATYPDGTKQGDLDGIVCDNLRGMAPELLDKIDITIDASAYPDADFSGSTVTGINPGRVDTSQKGHLYYYPPDEFNENPEPASVADVTKPATRQVTLSVRFTSGGKQFVVASKPIILARPPVVLVHGINNSPSVWNPFISVITGMDPNGKEGGAAGMDVPVAEMPFVAVNHYDPLSFQNGLDAGNAPVEIGAMLLAERIQKTIASVRNGTSITDGDENAWNVNPDDLEQHQYDGYKGKRLAMRRVDVVAWSYGGVITRWYLNQTKPASHGTWYKYAFRYRRDVNNASTVYTSANLPNATAQNDVRKVITLGSMWRGVPLINYGNEAVFGSTGFGHAPTFAFVPLVGTLFDLIIGADASHSFTLGLQPFRFLVPSFEVMAVESNWMRQLIYQNTADPSDASRLTAAPFDLNIAYGSVAGDDQDYPVSFKVLGIGLTFNTHPYAFFDSVQSPSWFSGLSIEYPANGTVGYSDGLVPLWSSAIPGSYFRADTPHNGYATDTSTQQYIVQWLNSAALSTGKDLTPIWNSSTAWNDDNYAVQTRDGSKRWRYIPGQMAPYPQCDLYAQVGGEGRLNSEAIASPVPVPINLLQDVKLARDFQKNIVATVTMANYSPVLAADVKIKRVSLIVGNTVAALTTSLPLGTLHHDSAKGTQKVSVPVTFGGSLGATGQPARVVVSYTYAGSHGEVTIRLNKPTLVLP